MKYSEYNRITEIIRKCRSKKEVEKLAESHDFKLPMKTLMSICTLERQAMWKEAFPRHNTDKLKKQYLEEFFERMKKQESFVILKMAKELDLSACMLIRFILDVYMVQTEPEKYAESSKVRARAITELLRHPHKVDNPYLASAVEEAIYSDDIYGPYPDRIRRAIGIEYEQRLKTWCKEQNIGFLSEEEMRQEGFDKTPDLKLTVPVALDGFVVNWIESKASFGNMEWHKKNLKEQIGPYNRRFGPGLVIYWFGFIDELDCQRKRGIALADGLPKTVVKIDLKQWEENADWEFPESSQEWHEGKQFSFLSGHFAEMRLDPRI